MGRVTLTLLDHLTTSTLYDDEGKYAEAEPLYPRSLDSFFHEFQYSFTYMTEKDRLKPCDLELMYRLDLPRLDPRNPTS